MLSQQDQDKHCDCAVMAQITPQLTPYQDIESKHDDHQLNYHTHRPCARSLYSKRGYRPVQYVLVAFIVVLLALVAWMHITPGVQVDALSLTSTPETFIPGRLATWGIGGYLDPNCKKENPINKGGSSAPSPCFNSTQVIGSVQFGSVPPGSFRYCTFTDSLCTQGAVLVNHPNLRCNQLDPFDPAVHALKVVSASCDET